MNSKYILLLIFFSISGASNAQININVPQAQITSGSEYQVSFNAGIYSSVLSLAPTFSVASSNANFTQVTDGTKSLPLSIANIKLLSVGSLSLLGSSNEVALSTQFNTLYAALLNLSSGNVIASLRLVTANQAWFAGTYKTSVQFRALGVLTGNLFSPASQDFNLIVPTFLTIMPIIPTTTLNINTFDFYRQEAGIAGSQNINVENSVPYVPSIRAEAAIFNFNTTASYNQLPLTNVNNLRFTFNGLATSTSILLTTNNQTLTSSEVAVPPGNKSSFSGQFSLSGNNLKLGFLQAGTYSIPLTFTWAKPQTAYPVGPLQQVSSTAVNVLVSDMAELVANQSTVALTVGTIADYKSGVVVNMPAHLRLSKTTPYNLYVRATSNNLSSGTNSIPLEVIEIGPMAGQSGMNTIILSTTAQQLINNADPALDRELNISYRIPANQTSKLMGKPADSYRTDIIYSFVAP